MSVTDPIADMFSAIKNAQLVRKDYVDVPSSKLKERILDLLKREGYIKDWERLDGPEHRKGTQYKLRIWLKYLGPRNTKPAIRNIVKVSKPGRRIYVPARLVPYVKRGLGVAIMSTDKGIITDKEARKLGVGGEVIGFVW
jgi:small subunit ribosomal protein S8